MTEEIRPTQQNGKSERWKHRNDVSGGIYGLAFIGALVYFIQNATTFWAGVLGILKAIIWPALLIYKLLEFFKNVSY